jgi:adenosylhomocysteine nucleosidase
MLQFGASGFLIVVCGLLAEGRIASGPGVRPIAGGGNAGQLASDIDRAIADGGTALVSFGLAGGLQPGIAHSTMVVASEVVTCDERFVTDHAWTKRVVAALPKGVEGTVLGVDAPVTSAADKRVLHAATGAAAVDMESHIAARAAMRGGLPFAVVRVIADPFDRALPAAALIGMGDDGRPQLGAVLGSLARNPAQLPALLRVAADARKAMAALVECRRLLGPTLGFSKTRG